MSTREFQMKCFCQKPISSRIFIKGQRKMSEKIKVKKRIEFVLKRKMTFVIWTHFPPVFVYVSTHVNY